MKRKTVTRSALFTSILALLLCVSMLVGTTFAWFTDEVVSGMNTIAAGNLDVELLANGDEVKSDTKLFNLVDAQGNDTWWEPGMVVYENLQVANVGTLALKYQMSLNFGSENDLNDHKLSEVLKVAVIDEIGENATRAEVLTAVKASGQVGTLADFSVGGELEAGKSSTEQAIVIFWEPNDNATDNLYNVNNGQKTSDEKPLHIEFGINLQATQKDVESDSFGPDYDEGLDPEASYVTTAAQLQEALKKGGNVVLMDDIALDNNAEFMATNGNGSLLYLDHVDVTLDLNGHDIVAEADAVYKAGKAPNALILVRYSTLNIVGEGSLITKNQSMPVYGWAHSEINIYGGTFKGNAYERNESDVYVNNDTVTINVYGGNFMDSVYAFNTHNTSANAPVIILHEGVTFKDFFKGTTNLIADDMNNGRIVQADGCYLKTYEVNGETVHEVAKKQEDTTYTSEYNTIVSGYGASKDYVLDGNLSVDNYIMFGDNTTNSIDLNGKTVSATGGFLFAVDGADCSLTIDGEGTVTTAAGYAGFASDSGSLNVNGGTYQLGETNNAAHFYSQDSGTIVINDGTFISADANTPIVYCINGFIEINGGFFQNTANPNAALLSMGNNLKYVNNQKITLSGGTFVNWNPMNSAFAMDWPQCPALIVLADGYEMVSETQANGDVWYSVVPVA